MPPDSRSARVCLLNSPLSAEHPWTAASPKAPPALPGSSRPALRGHGLSPAGPPEAPDSACGPAFLGLGGLAPAEAPGALRADNGFLPAFLPGAPGQPPLPEKKRASEGDPSLGSVSPASSGFSSPHSGSTMSIPFPSVLPDFSKSPEAAAAPSPGT